MSQRLQFKTKGEKGPGRGEDERGIFIVHQDREYWHLTFFLSLKGRGAKGGRQGFDLNNPKIMI